MKLSRPAPNRDINEPAIRPIQNHTVRHARKVAQGERQIKIGIRKVSGSNLRRIDRRHRSQPRTLRSSHQFRRAHQRNRRRACQKISSIHPHPSLTPFIVPVIRLNNMPPSALTKNDSAHHINPINNSTLRYNRHSAPLSMTTESSIKRTTYSYMFNEVSHGSRTGKILRV